MNHDFILYEIDYEKKRLVAHRANDSEFFDWSFNDRSLARQVFQERRSIHIADATRELDNIRETQLNPAGVLRFEITGPLFACPIRVGGQTEAVLVTWLKPISDPASERRPKTKTEQWFQSSSGQVCRLASLLANDIYDAGSSRAKEFLSAFYRSLDEIDHSRIWTRKKLRDSDFRERLINALMSALLHEACGLKRVRIWETTRKENLAHMGRDAISAVEGFRCIDSLTTSEVRCPARGRAGNIRVALVQKTTCTVATRLRGLATTHLRSGNIPQCLGRKTLTLECLIKIPRAPGL